MASLVFTDQESTIKRLFHAPSQAFSLSTLCMSPPLPSRSFSFDHTSPSSQETPVSSHVFPRCQVVHHTVVPFDHLCSNRFFPLLGIFSLTYFLLGTLVYGCGVPGASFIPCLVIGAGIGRSFGLSIHLLFPSWGLNSGTLFLPLLPRSFWCWCKRVSEKRFCLIPLLPLSAELTHKSQWTSASGWDWCTGAAGIFLLRDGDTGPFLTLVLFRYLRYYWSRCISWWSGSNDNRSDRNFD